MRVCKDTWISTTTMYVTLLDQQTTRFTVTFDSSDGWAMGWNEDLQCLSLRRLGPWVKFAREKTWKHMKTCTSKIYGAFWSRLASKPKEVGEAWGERGGLTMVTLLKTGQKMPSHKWQLANAHIHRSGWWEELRLKHVETPKTTRKKPWFPVDFSISSDMVKINNRLSFQHCSRWPIVPYFDTQPPKAFHDFFGTGSRAQIWSSSGFNKNHRQWVKNHHWGATASGHHPWIESSLSKYVGSQTPSTLANHQILGFDPSPYQHLWGCHSAKQFQFQYNFNGLEHHLPAYLTLILGLGIQLF